MSLEWITMLTTILIPPAVVAGFFWRADRREMRARRAARRWQDAVVRVNGGLHPDRVLVGEGEPIRLRFSRADDGESWWDDVEFPYARVIRELPEGETVILEIRPLTAGEYAIFAGMGTMRGTLVVEPRLTSARSA